MPMRKVLVACEWSGTVRDAFRAEGYEAWSCDLEPNPGPYHIQDDVRGYLTPDWDMLIGFPPCTYVCMSGIHWNKRIPGREEKTQAAIQFFKDLLAAPIPLIALENPVGILSSSVRKPDQIFQPWEFGHPEQKKTCLWLKGLPKLQPTNILPLPASGRWENQTKGGWNKLGPGEDRAKMRGKTYKGVAEAMAKQWGSYAHS